MNIETIRITITKIANGYDGNVGVGEQYTITCTEDRYFPTLGEALTVLSAEAGDPEKVAATGKKDDSNF